MASRKPPQGSHKPKKKLELVATPVPDPRLRVAPPAARQKKGVPCPVFRGGTVVLDRRWLKPVHVDLLTMRPYSSPSAPAKPQPFSMMAELDNNTVRIPRGFALSTLPEEAFAETTFACPLARSTFPKFVGTLRPMQAPAVRHIIDKLTRFPFHGILNAGCGIGKTTMFIYIACVLKVPVLVVAPDSTLYVQLQTAIKKHCPRATVGHFAGITNKKRKHGAFCVASLTTLSLLQDGGDAEDREFLKHYKFCVVDECHKSCAKTRMLAMAAVQAFYVLGLSATLNRGDRLMHGIEYLMGPVLYRISYLCCVDVQRVKYVDPGFQYVPMRWDKTKCNFSATMVALVHNRKRTNCIARLIRYYRNRGRNVIVLSRMTQVLKDLFNIFGPEEAGLVCGTVTSEAARLRRDVAKTKPLILGSEQLAATGLDKEDLDCMILVTPMKGGKPEDLRDDPRKQGGGCTLQQAAGRLTREDDSKAWPVLVDFYDGGPCVGSIVHGLTATRKRWYRDNKCEMLPELLMRPGDGNCCTDEFPTEHDLREAARRHADGPPEDVEMDGRPASVQSAVQELFGPPVVKRRKS